jgi:transposase-like protein
MTQGRVEVITSVERRRRWSAAEKRQLVAASLEPGASVSAIAREVGDSSRAAVWLAAAAAGSAATGLMTYRMFRTIR